MIIAWVPPLVLIVGLVFWYVGSVPRNPQRTPPVLLADIGRILFIVGTFFTVWMLAKTTLRLP